MDIEDKMNMCFNDELMENKILTEDEKKVLASLMYSYQICKEAKDNIIIRAMGDLRKDIKISNNAMYDAIRNLESLYHMIERSAGESRGKEKSSIASKFKLNFDAILHPPKKPVKFDFSKLIKSSETSINTVDIDTDIVIDTVTDIDKNNDIEKNTKTKSNIDNDVNTIIDLNNNIDSNLKTVINSNNNDVVFENEINNISNNNDSLINLDYYFINKSIFTYDDIQVKSQLNKLINSFKHIEDTKQLFPTLHEIFVYIKEHKNMFKSWSIEELKEKIENEMVIRYRELENNKKTHQLGS